MQDKVFYLPRSGWPSILSPGQGPDRKLPVKGQATRLEAWTWLGLEDWTKQVFPGFGFNQTSLTYAGGPVANLSKAWGWAPKQVRSFALELLEAQLIDDALCDAIVSVHRGVGHDRRSREVIPAKTRAAILKKTDGKCAYCAVVLTLKSGQPNSFHADHVLPVTKGGSDDVANLIPSCATCNLRKKDKTLVSFAGVKS